MQVTLKLTDHSWTQEKQYEKFEEELEEFYSALEEFKAYGNKRERYDLYVVDEGFDVCKSLQKYFSDHLEVSISDYFISFVPNYKPSLERFKDNIEVLNGNRDNYGIIVSVINELLTFLNSFCSSNHLNFSELLKKNDDKNEKKGVMKKVYLSDEDIEVIEEVRNCLITHNYNLNANNLEIIIKRIRK